MNEHFGMWAFSCEFGFQQGTCGMYEPDKQSRGFSRFSGCVSCKHRLPYNDATFKAEIAWRNRNSEH
jgi:hypothetical protein